MYLFLHFIFLFCFDTFSIKIIFRRYDMCRRRKGGRCTKGTAGKNNKRNIIVT